MIGNRICRCKGGYPFPLSRLFPSDWPLWTGPLSLTLDLCVLTPIVVLVGSSGLQLPAVSWSKQILVTWPWPPKKQQHLPKIMHREGFHQSKYIFTAFLILVAFIMKTLKFFPILKGFFLVSIHIYYLKLDDRGTPVLQLLFMQDLLPYKQKF